MGNSHFQNETNCKTFLVKMSFICIKINSHFHFNGFALSLALKQRLGELGSGLFRGTFFWCGWTEGFLYLNNLTRSTLSSNCRAFLIATEVT